MTVAREDNDVRDVLEDVHDGVTFGQERSPGVFAVAWREPHISSGWVRKGTMDLYSLHNDMTGTDETTNFHVTVSLTCSARSRTISSCHPHSSTNGKRTHPRDPVVKVLALLEPEHRLRLVVLGSIVAAVAARVPNEKGRVTDPARDERTL